ncbi:MAG: hypothetical protein ACRYHQ_08150 [Janthinobacterium lividum]
MSWLRDRVVLSGRVRKVALLLPLVGQAACTPPAPPIRLNPPQGFALSPVSPSRKIVRTASAPRPGKVLADAQGQPCTSTALHGLTAPRKAELFRQFAELEGKPVEDAPPPASLPPCPPGSR